MSSNLSGLSSYIGDNKSKGGKPKKTRAQITKNGQTINIYTPEECLGDDFGKLLLDEFSNYKKKKVTEIIDPKVAENLEVNKLLIQKLKKVEPKKWIAVASEDVYWKILLVLQLKSSDDLTKYTKEGKAIKKEIFDQMLIFVQNYVEEKAKDVVNLNQYRSFAELIGSNEFIKKLMWESVIIANNQILSYTLSKIYIIEKK